MHIFNADMIIVGGTAPESIAGKLGSTMPRTVNVSHF
jgi:hypothetical protein